MQEKTVITNLLNEKFVLDKHFLFKWNCIERKVEGKKVILSFIRDENISHLSEIETMENEYGEYKIGSMLPTIIFPSASFVLITVFLIVFLANKDNFNFPLFFPLIMGPALVCLILAFVFMFLRMKAINRIEHEKPLKDREFQERIANLK